MNVQSHFLSTQTADKHLYRSRSIYGEKAGRYARVSRPGDQSYPQNVELACVRFMSVLYAGNIESRGGHVHMARATSYI